MKRVPHARGVAQALRSVRVASQRSLKALNQAASQRMAKGDYATAEHLASKGREIQQFQLEADALSKRWREVCGAGARGSKKSGTPLWAYYQPILHALMQAGGMASRSDLEPEVRRIMGATFQADDRAPLGRGNERWQVMIRRARKHLVNEGWIESGPSKMWRITEAGRRAADSPIGREHVSAQ